METELPTRHLERTHSARLTGGSDPLGDPSMPVAAPLRQAAHPRSPLVPSRLAVSSAECVRSASANPRMAHSQGVPSLTPNSKRAVSRLNARPARQAVPSFALDLMQVKPAEDACYSPLRNARSPGFTPRQVQCVGNYDLDKTIGCGRFGKVKLATHVLTGQKVAVKIIRKKKLDAVEASLLRREVDILKTLNHPHIIKLYEVLETEQVLFLIMEHAGGGEVLDFVVAHKKVPEKRAKELFRQIVSAFEHIHSKNIAHRDLKAENILLDEHLNTKVIDFGLSNFFTPSQLLKTPCGSPSYAAPELIRKLDYDGPAADIWSLGVCLYVIVCGVLPFKPTDLVNLYDKVLKGEYDVPDFVSSECRDLLSKMIVVDPARRLTICDIRRHPWVADPTSPVIAPFGEEEVADPAIIREMVRVGFKEDIAIESAKRNSCNPASATFSILMDRKRKRESLQSMRSVRRAQGRESSTSIETHKMVSRVQSEDLGPQERRPERASPFSKSRRPIARRTESSETSAPKVTHKRTKSHGGKVASPECGLMPAKETVQPPLTTNVSLCPDGPSRLPSPPSSPAPLIGQSSPAPATFAQRRLIHTGGHRRSHSVDVKHSEKGQEFPATIPIFNKVFEAAQSSRELKRGSVNVPPSVSIASIDQSAPPAEESQLNRSLTERSVRLKALTEEEAAEWHRSAEQEHQELAAHLHQPDAIEEEDGQSKKAFRMILSYTRRLLSKRAADGQQPVEPRQARVAFPNTMSTSMEPDLIMPILEEKLKDLTLQFMRQDSFCIKVVSVDMNVQFEVEICRMPRLSAMYCIRTKRVGGDWESYRGICQRLYASLEPAVA